MEAFWISSGIGFSFLSPFVVRTAKKINQILLTHILRAWTMFLSISLEISDVCLHHSGGVHVSSAKRDNKPFSAGEAAFADAVFLDVTRKILLNWCEI